MDAKTEAIDRRTRSIRPGQASGHDRGSDLGGCTQENAGGSDAEMAGGGSSSSLLDASTRRTPAMILSQIFSEFAAKRQQEKVSAWMFLQQALASNAGILCPSAVSLKDLIA